MHCVFANTPVFVQHATFVGGAMSSTRLFTSRQAPNMKRLCIMSVMKRKVSLGENVILQKLNCNC